MIVRAGVTASQQMGRGIEHRNHVVQFGRRDTLRRTPVPRNKGHLHLHLSRAALRVDDGDPLTHSDFADRLNFCVIVYDGYSVDCVRWYHHQLPGAAIQTLLPDSDPDPAAPYPPDFIALVAVQSDAQVRAEPYGSPAWRMLCARQRDRRAALMRPGLGL